MLIRNIGEVKNVFVCGGFLGKWLNEKMNVPFLGIDSKAYYFADNQELRRILEESPFFIKIALWLEKK